MAIYQFRLEGHLDNRWTEWLGATGLTNPTWQLAISSFTLGTPFLIVGWLFSSVGRQRQAATEVMVQHQPGASGAKAYQTYLKLLLIALLTITSIVIFFRITVQQHVEFSSGDAPVSGVASNTLTIVPSAVPLPPAQAFDIARSGVPKVDLVIETILSNALVRGIDLLQFVTYRG